jgi:radical SAM superfamily enzyme YgiQ (UPF0313 family)
MRSSEIVLVLKSNPYLTEMKKILLNYLPPSDVYTPSASLSILKSFMLSNGFDTEVKYWNFLFAEVLALENCDETEAVTLPFISILNDQNNNSTGNNRAISLLQKMLPAPKGNSNNYYRNLLHKTKSHIYDIIHKELKKIDFSETLLFGISSKFHQWIPGMILSEEIKKISPGTKIIVGGFGSKEAALEVMKINKYFDFATWGEGEYPLLELSKQLQDETNNFGLVPRLVYRNQNSISLSPLTQSNYLDFEKYIFPDYDDYFKNFPEPDKKYKITVPINSTRACCWNKCKFCDYNRGYKYRARSAECIVKEIEYITKKFESACFTFVDNDIFVSPEHFEKLLNLIIESINKYNYDYEFWAEMIPNQQLNAGLLKKMQIAGFTQVFIGYDGISDSLLRKMNKSNNFSNNIFFVKYALKYGINPLVNIIKGVIDETEEDVREGMNNLHFLRFFYNEKDISLTHDYATLVISNMTKYYSMISEEEKEKYDVNRIAYLLPDHFSNHNNRFCLFRWEKGVVANSAEWDVLVDIEKYYIENKFSYKISKNSGIYNFAEYVNNKEILNIDFEGPYYWDVLKTANQKVCTFSELYAALKKPYPEISKERLKKILRELRDLYLVYCNTDLSDVITVIDVDRVFGL